MVAADEEYLAQIMRNLLSNAAKYSGTGSTVEVSLEDGDGEVLIRVRDNGPGISEDDADRLFNLYYRSSVAAQTAPGAGIGLFVCRELVAAMGGRIWAHARPEGGSEFGFSIPAYVDELDFQTDDTVSIFEREPVAASNGTPLASGAVAATASAATPEASVAAAPSAVAPTAMTPTVVAPAAGPDVVDTDDDATIVPTPNTGPNREPATA
jgi:hypothetical protein